jgi:beta-N-acetylhexosaminidase
MGFSPGGRDDVDPAVLARGVLAVGFNGADAASAPIAALRALGPGAVVLFGRNVAEPAALRELIAALRGIGSPPPLIAIDQEGGRVARIRSGVTQLPSAMAVGATDDPALAEGLGALLGRDLARLGISVDLAPVADLATFDANSIGTRAYSDDPSRVASFAGSFARGLARGGIAATLKHFPGHGAAATDSHVTLPRVSGDAATLRARDLAPFARLVAERAAQLIMTAHVVVEAFDALRPATLSPAILQGLLRDELGFDGAIVTDCLEMDAIAAQPGTVNGALQALEAGADLLLISHHVELAEAAAEAICRAVEDGSIPLERLRDAHARVMRLRAGYAELRPFDGPLDDELPREAARRAVTVLRGDPRLRDGLPVTVISFEAGEADYAGTSGARSSAAPEPSLSRALRERRVQSEHMRVVPEPDTDDVTLLLDHVRRLGAREFVLVTRNAHRFAAQHTAVERILHAAPDAIVLSAASPLDALLWPAARRVACIYGDTPLAFEGCADVLTGRAAARGRFPLHSIENVAVR